MIFFHTAEFEAERDILEFERIPERAIGFLNYYFFTLMARSGYFLTGAFARSFIFLSSNYFYLKYNNVLYHYSGLSLLSKLSYSNS